MTAPSDLQVWLDSTAEKRESLLQYSLTPLPVEPGERQLDVSKALEHGQDAGDLLADAEQFVILGTADAVLKVKKEYPDLSADERKLIVKGRVSDIIRLRDGIEVIYRTIKDRRFALMNLNRSA